MNTKQLLTFFTLLLAGIALFDCKGNPYKQGKILYENFCANCHMDDGSGLEGNIPPLAGADYVGTAKAEIACIIRHGQEGVIVVNGISYSAPMPAVPELSDFEITNVINYINHAWGNEFGIVKLSEVRAALEACD